MRLGAILVKRSLGGSLLPIVTELANTLALNEPCSFPDLIRGVPCPLAITVFGASRRHLPCPPMAKPSRVHFKRNRQFRLAPVAVSAASRPGPFSAGQAATSTATSRFPTLSPCSRRKVGQPLQFCRWQSGTDPASSRPQHLRRSEFLRYRRASGGNLWRSRPSRQALCPRRIF